jgi:hypothetical protein
MRRVVVYFSLFFTLTAFSQSYTTAIGLKGGNSGGYFGSGGINLKHFIAGSNALELTVGGGSNHLRAQLLYEWQKSIDAVDGLDWYVGLGGTVGTWSGSYVHPNGKWTHERGLYLGAVGVVGLDWNLDPVIGIPLNVAIDAGPYVGIINSGNFGWGGAFAIRYILK